MNVDDAITALGGDPIKAVGMAAYHKVDRPYLGVANPDIDVHVKAWRAELSFDDRLQLARDLWATNIHEGMIGGAKLLSQARIKPDDSAVWDIITSWVPTFDAWAVADHACIAGQKRLVADPSRLDEVETWITSDRMWTKRAALVMTLPWTKQNHPKPDEEIARDRILSWAATYVTDHDWFIQKSVAWWLRDLSKHDEARTRAFLDAYGDQMKPFARKEAASKLPTAPE